jgi:hypothetical protein
MKLVLLIGLFNGLAAAHSAVWSVTVDGNKFVDQANGDCLVLILQ